MPPHQHALFQLPFINPEIIKHCDTKKVILILLTKERKKIINR